MASIAWKVAPWLGCILLGYLLLQANQEIGRQIEACNASKLSEVAAAEREVRQAERANHAREMQAQQRLFEGEIEARKKAEAERLQALSGVEVRDERIRQLELEASIDDIPDSREALNVFVPAELVERMWSDENCDQAGDSGSSENGICSGSLGPVGDNGPGFARITYADALFAWNHDRKSLRQCNIDKRAIAEIGD